MFWIWLLVAFAVGFYCGVKALYKKLSPLFTQIEQFPEKLESFSQLTAEKQREFIATVREEWKKEYAHR